MQPPSMLPNQIEVLDLHYKMLPQVMVTIRGPWPGGRKAFKRGKEESLERCKQRVLDEITELEVSSPDAKWPF